MAATCEERGIKHVKDVFSNAPKSSSITFMARKPVAPAPPSKTSAGDLSTLKKAQNNDTSKSNGVYTGSAHSKEKSSTKGGDLNGNLGTGEYFLRADKDKHINTLELPVPVAPPRKTRQSKTSDSSENVYLMPSPVSSPTSPGYNTTFPSPTSPGYSKEITETTKPSPGYDKNITKNPTSPGYDKSIGKQKPSSPGYSSKVSAPAVKYPAPPVPTSSPGYSKAVATFQSPSSPSYNTEINGSSSPKSPTYRKEVPMISSTSHIHHAQVHQSVNVSNYEQNASPTYERKFDFITPNDAPKSPDNETGSLFSGYNQDSPCTTPPLSSPAIVLMDKTNNNGPSLFKKNNKQDRNNRFGKKRLSGDETNSSLAPSSGYHSEFDSEFGETSPVVDRSKGHQNLNSSFEEEECTLEFGDDDEMYTGGHRYALYQEYEGEDFAKYLDDDGDFVPQPNTTSLARKVQRRRQYLDQAPRAPKQYASNPRNKPGIKQRLSQALTLTKQEKGKYIYQPQSLTKIHQFSFMDSKMGHFSDEHEIQEYMSRDLETRSDLGGVKKRISEVPSWHNDTLSMSTLRKAKKLLDQQHQFSNSVPNLSNSKENSPMRASNPDLAHKGESYSDFGADIKRKKKVNRFKFWKLFGRKKDKGKENGKAASSLGFDEPTFSREHERIMDVRL